MKYLKRAMFCLALATSCFAMSALAADCGCLSCAELEINCEADCRVNGFVTGELQYCENNIYGCAQSHGACVCSNTAPEDETPWLEEYPEE